MDSMSTRQAELEKSDSLVVCTCSLKFYKAKLSGCDQGF